jgi:putative transposase
MFMRMYENFSGCRVLSYCIMCNHIHLLVEVPPKPVDGISDELFLKRLSATAWGQSFLTESTEKFLEIGQGDCELHQLE